MHLEGLNTATMQLLRKTTVSTALKLSFHKHYIPYKQLCISNFHRNDNMKDLTNE